MSTHQEAGDNVPLMARNTTNQVAGVYEMCEGTYTPNLSYFENIPIENLHMSDSHDRQAERFATKTHSVVWFPVKN